jgi:hypothetical protein
MCPLPSSDRPISGSETPRETGSVAEAFGGKDYYQELIGKANTIPIIKVLKHYNVRVDAYNKNTCPLRTHKGGRERTPSFKVYPETNTFFCFGCKAKSRPCDFVALMDNCSRVQAAHKLLKLFESDVDEDNIYSPEDFEERLRIMMEFSEAVRDFYRSNSGEKAAVYVEAACKKFDALNTKNKLNNEALARIVEEFKEYIRLYKP